MKVLVGYASAHGSTREIAEHLGERLRRHGLHVDVRDLADTRPAGYDAFVLGSAVHNQHWLPEALAFVREYVPDLAARPVWMFSVGMPGALRWPLRLGVGQQSKVVGADFVDLVSFRDHTVFSGVVRDGHLPLFGRLLAALLTRGPGDYRDWGCIDAWADGIARVLGALPDLAHGPASAPRPAEATRTSSPRASTPPTPRPSRPPATGV